MLLSRLAFLLAIMLCSAVAARSPLHRVPRGAEATGSYIVVLREETTEEQFKNLKSVAARVSTDTLVVTSEVGKTITAKLSAQALEEMRHRTEVDHIEEEGMAYGEQVADLGWHLDRIDQLNLPLDGQYQPVNSGEGVDLYILDSGINYDHEEFQGRAKYAGYDPIDNRYPGDPQQHGRDCHGHGTHVASLAGGATFGSAKKVNLFSVRVLNCNNRAPWSVVLDGLDYTTRMIKRRKRLAVVSMSLGGHMQQAANNATTAIYRCGVPVVVAAGNSRLDACDFTPAGAQGAITVGGTSKSDNLYSSTNMGRCVDIFAPGSRILAADHSCSNCSKILSGTSMACPIISGIVVMILEQYPRLNPDEILELLINKSAKNVIDLHSSGLTDELVGATPNRLIQTDGGCGGYYSGRSKFTIHSPNYPLPHPLHLKCEWKIEVDGGEELEIVFGLIELRGKYNKLLVCNGCHCNQDIAAVQYTGFHDGKQKSLRYRSSGNLTILLLTDWDGENGRGFVANITKYYAGTNLTVPDTNIVQPIPDYPPVTHVNLSVSAGSIHQVVAQWKRRGFNIAAINVHKPMNGAESYYSIIVHNGTVRTREALDLTAAELNREITRQATDGYSLWSVSGKVRSNDTTPLYSVIFGRNPDYIETTVLVEMDFFSHFFKSFELLNAKWSIISQLLLSSNGHISLTSAYQRDRRPAQNITVPPDQVLPERLALFGLRFTDFSNLTLERAQRFMYPRQVQIYFHPGVSGSRFSVVYEQSADHSSFFRWGLNKTETQAAIELYRNSWDPVIVTSYRYNTQNRYFVMWERRRVR